ncbi:MAG TPA: DUF3300 domain-containing protein [Variovorax sp.]|nr:DUF3300 domain-containing protein [Variovorax sp.]
MSKLISRWLLGTALLCLSALAPAQSKLDKPQLDQLMAPVALYPDALLSQVLMASTYPDDVKTAAEWSKANQNLSGDPAVKAVEGEAWDPSVKSLAAFPSVLDMMGRQPQWVQSAGDAFLDQPEDVMDSVQRLRRQAQEAGTLKSNEQQKVVVQQEGPAQVIQIEPAQPQVVYVPQYNPTVVYGAWPYPAYPPYYYPPPVGSVFATALIGGIGFGLGVAAVNSMWGGFNWGGNNVNINVNRYNNVNVNNRLNANQTNFQHNAARRGSTPYRGDASRQRFDGQRQAGMANRDGPGARPGGGAASSRDAARDRAAGSFEQRTGQGIPGHDGRGGAGGGRDRAGQGGAGDRVGQAGGAGDRRGQGAGAGAGDRRGEGAGAGAGDRRGQGAGTGDRAGQGGAGRDNPAARQRQDHNAAMDRSRAANKDSAFRDAGNGARVQQQAQRPGAQRQAGGGGGVHQTAARPAGGGGGAHAGGGGGGGGARAGGGGGGGGARGGGGGGGGHRGGGGGGGRR